MIIVSYTTVVANCGEDSILKPIALWEHEVGQVLQLIEVHYSQYDAALIQNSVGKDSFLTLINYKKRTYFCRSVSALFKTIVHTTKLKNTVQSPSQVLK